MDTIYQNAGALHLEASELEKIAKIIRRDILTLIANAGSGHTGGSLSGTDYLTALLFNEVKLDPKVPKWEERDFWNVSNAHVSPLIYSAMAERGYFPLSDLLGFRQFTGKLQGHPSAHDTPGLETSAGSLGQGLGIAVGAALAAKLDKKPRRHYCCMGDGEQQEGSVWEAAMSAAHYKLDNLVGIIDYNRLQIDGNVSEVLEIASIVDKYRSFGWHVIDINGHNMKAILNAFREAKEVEDMPTMIIANTVMGKGWPEIEDNHIWHGRPPTISEADQGLRELGTTYDEWRMRLENDGVVS